jgi:hypothetical protein
MFGFLGQIFKFFKNIKLILKMIDNFQDFLIKAKDTIVTDMKKHPNNYIIGSLLVICLLLSGALLKNWLTRDIVLSKNSYNVVLEGSKMIIKAPISGKIVSINEQLLYFSAYPFKTVTIPKKDLLISFDSVEIDQKLKDLKRQKLDIGGKKTIITEEVTKSPDEDELINIQTKIDSLRIERAKTALLLQEARSGLVQAEELYSQKVVTQTFLNEAKTKYLSLENELNLLDSLLENQEKLYNQKSKFQTRNNIIVRSEKNIENSNQVNIWVQDLNNQIDQALELKQNTVIYSDEEFLVKRVHIFIGKFVKKGDVLIEGISTSSLTGLAELSSSDVKLIKSKKTKIYYEDRITGVKHEVNYFSLKGNKLSFKLPDLKSSNGRIIVERVIK